MRPGGHGAVSPRVAILLVVTCQLVRIAAAHHVERGQIVSGCFRLDDEVRSFTAESDLSFSQKLYPNN